MPEPGEVRSCDRNVRVYLVNIFAESVETLDFGSEKPVANLLTNYLTPIRFLI